eukprot:Opistho-2@8016
MSMRARGITFANGRSSCCRTRPGPATPEWGMKHVLSCLAAALLLGACVNGGPAPTPLQPAALAEIDKAITHFIATEQMPGAQFWLEAEGRGRYHRAYGQRALEPVAEPLDEQTLFDAASLTKVIVTATAMQLLRERGQLDVEAPLGRYLAECHPCTLR